jgi:hypothetical protein
VDGLEQKFDGKLTVIRLDFLSTVGRAAARRYGVRLIPAILLFDERADELNRQIGLLNPAEITKQLNLGHNRRSRWREDSV